MRRVKLMVISLAMMAAVASRGLAQTCGSAGCTNADAWVSNQGGGTKPCYNTTLPANVETVIAADNAGSYNANATWNYAGQGEVYLNTLGQTVGVLLKVYYGDQALCGNGPNGCYTTRKRTISLIKGLLSFGFNFIEVVITNDYQAFYITLTPSATIKCRAVDYHTTEHSNP